jgi:ubiquinone/menaquinone biosynthesis C-methylase UbiE
MNDDFVQNIQENYDRLATEYSAHIFDELQHKPLDCELLRRFAAGMRDKGDVCDMACGPGHVAKFLHDAGVSAFGLDLSSRMVDQARRLSPDIEFRQGNMLNLDLPDASLAGITAMYAIVNIPNESLPKVFQEMWRVLQPGGTLLTAFHIGNEQVDVPELWGEKVTMPFFFLDPANIRFMLEKSGFVVDEIVERGPYPEIEFQSRRAYVFARKP